MNVPLFFSDAFLHALLWMLVHSLWQGLVAAALAGVVIIGTRRHSAALRYNLLVLICSIYLLAVACTFGWYYQSTFNSSLFAGAVNNTDALTFSDDYANNVFAGDGWLQLLAGWINQHADTLIAFWLVITSFKSLRLLLHYRQVLVLRSRKLQPVDPYWQRKLLKLCGALGVHHAVGFFESRIAKVPMVVGYCKPVLLVPVGFINGLPPEDVEAILVHELAHIRRSDYLVNVLQNLVELVFFFNLPLLWISAQIRKEREHCCDDIAVAYSGNKRGYIEALVAFQEQGGTNVYVAAFSGKRKMPLLERVKRLIYNHNQTLSTMEKISLLTSVLAVSLIAFAFTGKAQDQAPKPASAPAAPTAKVVPTKALQPAIEPLKPVVAIEPHAAGIGQVKPMQIDNHERADTTGKGRHEVNTIINGKRYQMTLVNDKLVELSIDGVPVPESRFHEYNDVVKTILEHKARAEEHAKVAQEHAKRAEEMSRMANENARRAEALSREAEARAKEAAAHSRDAEVRAKEAVAHEARVKEHIERAEEHAKRAQEHAAQAEIHGKEAQVHAKVYEHLVKEGLVKKGDMNTNISVKDGKLIINGVEQPKEVYEKYQKLIEEERKRLGLR